MQFQNPILHLHVSAGKKHFKKQVQNFKMTFKKPCESIRHANLVKMGLYLCSIKYKILPLCFLRLQFSKIKIKKTQLFWYIDSKPATKQSLKHYVQFSTQQDAGIPAADFPEVESYRKCLEKADFSKFPSLSTEVLEKLGKGFLQNNNMSYTVILFM